MSGGGSFGAYEAGVLYGLYHSISDKSLMEYDVVTGVSAGSINAGAVSIFAKGDEGNMVQTASDLWAELTTEQVYVNWPGGMVEGVLKESGVYNDTPLLEYLTGVINSYGGLKRKTVVTAVDVNTGAYHIFNETNPNPGKMAVSSSSIPFVFPDQQWPEEELVLMDGGTVWNINLVSAVQRCREDPDIKDEDIIVDLINCDRNNLP